MTCRPACSYLAAGKNNITLWSFGTKNKERRITLGIQLYPAHLVHDHLGLGNLELFLARLLLHRLKVLHLRDSEERIHSAVKPSPCGYFCNEFRCRLQMPPMLCAKSRQLYPLNYTCNRSLSHSASRSVTCSERLRLVSARAEVFCLLVLIESLHLVSSASSRFTFSEMEIKEWIV